MQNKPDLTFFCELPARELAALFEDRFVLDDLKTLNAAVSLGILDLSPERAEVVRKMNLLNIPVIAWLLLPKDQGYWFNLENYPYAIARYEDFKIWSRENDLRWAGIGLDIEPDYNQMEAFHTHAPRFYVDAFKRLNDHLAYDQAMLAYTGLVHQAHADGFEVEAYHIPQITDDRKAGSNVLQRLVGLVDVPVDREVLMLYSSFSPSKGHALLAEYASETDSVGIGNTGGGVQIEGWDEEPYLTWEDFSTDLRLAWQTGKPVHIFSLEGCVRQGFLDRLITFDWNQAVPTQPDTNPVKLMRKGLQTLLWVVQRPWVILAGLSALVGGLLFRKGSNKNN